MRVAFSSAAHWDRLQAEAWYRRRSPVALQAFIRELNKALRFIAEWPEGAPKYVGETRGKTLANFPYSVIYEIKPDRILVMAIADERRDPGTYDDHLQ